ncbi:MAG: TonB-dependent receptor plug domain-containing protein, partial [Gemmatimonadota bacterium]
MSGNTPRRSASRRSSAPLQILVLAALALAPPAGVDAQHHAPDAPATVSDTLALHGVVLDSASGEPLPASTVRLLEVDRQDYTHDDGTFHLYRVPEGRYTLIVEHLGYRTADVDVRLPRAVPGQLVVRLQSSALDLPGLLVTATMGARSRSEAHQLSQVLGGRDLQRELEATVAETLAGGAGMASTSMGPAPARPVIRGLSGDRILVLEDGERVGDVSSASPDHAVSVEAASAKRIEVVRGPSALFYGSNALGGVINVVRDEIPTALPDHPTGAVTVQGQSVNRGGAASGAFAQRIGPVAFRFEGSGRWADDTRTPDGPLG